MDDKCYAWVIYHLTPNKLKLFWTGGSWSTEKESVVYFLSQALAMQTVKENNWHLGGGLCVDQMEISKQARDHLIKLGRNALFIK